VRTYLEGTLVVDLFDAANRKLVWRGVATDTVSDNPQKNAEHIDKAVEKMFGKKFMEGGCNYHALLARVRYALRAWLCEISEGASVKSISRRGLLKNGRGARGCPFGRSSGGRCGVRREDVAETTGPRTMSRPMASDS